MIEAIIKAGPTLEAAGREAEIERRLPEPIVDVLRERGLFWLKTPNELGGSELEPLDFSDVVEQLAYFDASAAWAAMVGNGTTGTMAGWLPDGGVEELFADLASLPIVAGQFIPRGQATTVDGGFVTGRWGFSSGIDHASWWPVAAAVEIIPNAGHLVAYEQLGGYCGLVEDFLSEV